MTQLLIYILLISIIILFIISIIYTLVIKPRNLIIKRLIDENINEKINETRLAELRDKIKNNVKSQITKIKGKFIKIGNNFDDLSTELKNELAKCYQEGGCIF